MKALRVPLDSCLSRWRERERDRDIEGERESNKKHPVFILSSWTDEMALDVIFAVIAAAATEINDVLGGK